MIRLSVVATLIATPGLAEDLSQYGSLNPDEMTLSREIERAGRGETSMMTCAAGYMITKKGDHEDARTVFETCADAGYTGAMTWMSQLDNNGLGADYDPDAAAEWDRRAADSGDPVGMFNYGLNLLRGHGVEKDEALGREYIDTAAREGLKVAKRLQDAGYDPDEVTPDADNWKYAPLF
ncbi:MAG: sel1 repeat family protein [Dinoroseobacter sp.]|nr:sel1 repeat family protein [Dinoroseobacter sp.]